MGVLAIPLWIIIILSVMFASASDSTTSGGASVLSNESRYESLVDARGFSVDEVGVAGQDIQIPNVSASWVTKTFEALTWDFSYIKSWMQPIRLIFMALTYWATGVFIVNFAPVFISIAELMGTIATSIVGGFGNVLRVFFRGI